MIELQKHKYTNNEGSSTPSPWLRVLEHNVGKKSNNRKETNNFLINSSLKDIIQWILSGKLKKEVSETGILPRLITESAERNW